MDMAAWLWERVERRDAPAVLAHALSLAPTRDALLRHAAITGQWDALAAASAEAADVARHVGWSRSGPDAVRAICHWISADRTLRRIPSSDRAAPLAHAALAAWTAPRELATRLAGSTPLSSSQSMDFEQAPSTSSSNASAKAPSPSANSWRTPKRGLHCFDTRREPAPGRTSQTSQPRPKSTPDQMEAPSPGPDRSAS